MKKILSLICALVICMVLGACDSPSAKSTVEDFAAALDSGDIEKVIDCCDSETAELVGFATGMANGFLELVGVQVDTADLISLVIPQFMDTIADGGKGLSYHVAVKDLKEEIKDSTHATVAGIWVIEVSANGQTRAEEIPLELEMVKEDAGWKVDLTGLSTSALNKALGI